MRCIFPARGSARAVPLLAVVSVLSACGGSGQASESSEASAPASVLDAEAGQSRELPVVEVYKSPTCGCCAAWVEHLKERGFQVRTVDDDARLYEVKREKGITPELASCHTAIVDGYVIEGHVPAEAIERLLAERPAGAKGLAVPGMPMGSPGMEGDRTDPYDVLLLKDAGEPEVYESRGKH